MILLSTHCMWLHRHPPFPCSFFTFCPPCSIAYTHLSSMCASAWNGHVDSSHVSIGFNSSSQTAAPLAQQMDGTCIVNALWNTRLCHAVIIHLTGCLHSVIHLGNESDDRKVWLYNLNNHVYIPWEWFSSPCSMLPSLSSAYRPRKRADQACQSQFLFCLCSISPPTCSYII